MIYEYAIEPEVLVAWVRTRLACRYIYDNFGLGKPRLMAEFPKFKNWRKQMRQAAISLSDIELLKLEELFKHLKEVQIKRLSDGYDGTETWLINAEKENAVHPFRAILATENPKHSPHVLENNRLGDWSDAFWAAKQGVSVKRQAQYMADAIAPMLQICQKVVFVDPYFGPGKVKCTKPLQAFITEYLRFKPEECVCCIEMHCSADYPNTPPLDFFKNECLAKLPKFIPKSVQLIIKRWNQRNQGEKLHNRYVLTDLGGVIFNIGLDQGAEGETDDVTLMTREQYQIRWRQYASDNPAFDLECNFLVNGSQI